MADNYLITGYWGEPHVTAENDRGINAAIFGPGRFVLPVGEQFKAEYIGNNTVRVYDGKLVDNGAVGGIPAGRYVDLTISETGQGMNRNDLIVFQYTKDTSTLVESGTFVVVKGTETTGTASDPALTQADLLSDSATFDQMALWRVPVSTATISAPVQVFTVLNNLQGVKSVADGKAPRSHASTGTTYGAASASVYGHAKASGTTPKAPGTAAVGSETAAFARGDHVHPEQVSAHGINTGGTGAAYTATVEGITALTAGASFIMIPHVASTSTAPTLNVNGLGAKTIRRRVSNSAATTTAGSSADWLSANKPIIMFYDGTYWIADLVKPNANDLYGTVPIGSGGLGADNVEDARENLGVVSVEELPYLYIWKQYDGNPALVETKKTDSTYTSIVNENETLEYADEISVVDGVISLVNPSTVTASGAAALEEAIAGKYIYAPRQYTNHFCFVPEDATVGARTVASQHAYFAVPLVVLSTGGSKLGYAISKKAAAYPENGEHTDGYWYVYNKQLGD